MPFSLDSLERTGDPFLITSRGMLPSVSVDGTLVHVHASALERVALVWVDARGEITGSVSQAQAGIQRPSVSPDGSRVAATSRETESRDVWIHDVKRGTRTRLTFADGDHYTPGWSPDGRAVIYAGLDEGIYRKGADGSDTAETLTTGKQPRFSPDGKHLVFVRPSKDRADDIWQLALEEGAQPVALLATAADEDTPEPSPDGRYLAYESNESGQNEIYLTRFPTPGGKWQVSVQGGEQPRWSRDGNELFFLSEGRMMAVGISTDASTPVLDTPRVLFPLPSRVRAFPGYDVAPDGRFVMVAEEELEDKGPPSILVVQSWYTPFRIGS
jgi:Tol biopolymer transport system component